MGTRGGAGHADVSPQATLSSKSGPEGDESPVSFSFCFPGRGGGQVEQPFVDQFGFDVVTCCGYLPQVSDTSIWPLFPNQLGCSEIGGEACEI